MCRDSVARMSTTTRHEDTLQNFFEADPFNGVANNLPNSDLGGKEASGLKLCHLYKIGRGSSADCHSARGGFVTDVRHWRVFVVKVVALYDARKVISSSA